MLFHREKIVDKLMDHFSRGITSRTLETIGAEIETQFVGEDGQAVMIETSQNILRHLVNNGWNICGTRSGLITLIADDHGNKVFQEFEMGRHHLEIATAVSTPPHVIDDAKQCLTQLYEAASIFGAIPHKAAILPGNQDLIIEPDSQDTDWIDLDGREVLAPLARTSSVQFTVSVALDEVILILNKLGERINSFLSAFPQDVMWRQYIGNSHAKYLSDRYGGPLFFDSINDYCRLLARHDVIRGTKLVPYTEIESENITSFVRSIWWYFRLRRYENALCVEVRPIGRAADEQLEPQLEMVLSAFS